MKRVPGVSSQNGSDSLADLVEEITDKLQAGESIDWQVYYDRQPERAEELRQLLPALAMLAAAEPSAHGSAGDGPDARPLPGVLGDFRLGRELGRGGMGVVYEAEQLSLRRKVALKVLPFAAVLDPRHLQRFKNEAQAAAHLHHPHIVPVYGVGCERGIHYYAMQYIEGQTLASVIDQLRRAGGDNETRRQGDRETTVDRGTTGVSLSPGLPVSLSTDPRHVPFFQAAARLAIQAAEALDHAHELGVVHRDVKPANLLVDVRGNVWVADFGLAQFQTDQNLTLTGHLVGTLRYMSPEQALAKRALIDHRTDIYSLGVTLYELLTLRPAFEAADRQELLHQLVAAEPTPPSRLAPAIPHDLETVVLKATAKDPAERYLTAGEFAADLRRFLDDKPVCARRPNPAQRSLRWLRRHRRWVAVGGIFALASLIGLVAGAVLIARERTAAWQRDEAAAQSARLVERELAVLRRLYVEDVTRASETSARGDINEMNHLLRRYEPGRVVDDLRGAVRGFEWRYLRWLCHGGGVAVATLAGHAGEVYGVAFSPDGQTLASVGQDRTVRIWDVASARTLHVLTRHTDEVNGVAFSPDGTVLATASDDQTVRLWDVRTGGELRQLLGHTGKVLCVAFSPDGARVASGGRDNTIRLWAARRDGQPTVLRTAETVEYLAFSADGRQLICAAGDIVAWELANDQASPTPLVPSVHSFGGALSVTCARHSSAIFTGHRSGQVWTWNGRTGMRERGWRAHSLQIDALALLPGGKTLATGARDGAIRTWNTTSSEAGSQWVGHSSGVWCMAVSDRSNLLASAGGDGAVKLWRMGVPQNLLRLQGGVSHVTRLALVPRSTAILTGHDTLGKVVRWDRATRQSETIYDKPASIPLCGLAATPDGAAMFVGRGDGTIEEWDLAGRTLRRTLPGDSATAGGFVLAPNGRWLATVGAGPTAVGVWDLHQPVPSRHVLPTRCGRPECLAFLPDGRGLAVADFDSGEVAWWDLSDGQPTRRPFPVRHEGIRCLQFSPDGTVLAAGSSDRTIRLWDVPSAVPRGVPCLLDGSVGEALTFSPDGKTLAARIRHNGIRLFNVATARSLFDLHRHNSPCPSGALAFSDDGTVLVSAGNAPDGSAEVFLFPAPHGEEESPP